MGCETVEVKRFHSFPLKALEKALNAVHLHQEDSIHLSILRVQGCSRGHSQFAFLVWTVVIAMPGSTFSSPTTLDVSPPSFTLLQVQESMEME